MTYNKKKLKFKYLKNVISTKYLILIRLYYNNKTIIIFFKNYVFLIFNLNLYFFFLILLSFNSDAV